MLCKGIIIAFIFKERFAAYAGAFILRPDYSAVGFAKFAFPGRFLEKEDILDRLACIPNIHIVFTCLGRIFVAGRARGIIARNIMILVFWIKVYNRLET